MKHDPISGISFSITCADFQPPVSRKLYRKVQPRIADHRAELSTWCEGLSWKAILRRISPYFLIVFVLFCFCLFFSNSCGQAWSLVHCMWFLSVLLLFWKAMLLDGSKFKQLCSTFFVTLTWTHCSTVSSCTLTSSKPDHKIVSLHTYANICWYLSLSFFFSWREVIFADFHFYL